MNQESVNSLLAEIERLKREKPKYWKATARHLIAQLRRIKEPPTDCEWRGTEQLGRRRHIADCPSFDTDEDWPSR